MMSSSAARDVIQPARQRYLSLLFILQALLAVVVVAGTLSGLRDMREEVLKGHLRQASLQVRGFEDHVSQNLFLVDLMLTNLPELLADPRLGNAKNHGGLLQSIQRQMPALRSFPSPAPMAAYWQVRRPEMSGCRWICLPICRWLPLRERA
ncbi:MAG: hypothetical protein IPN05_03275 [Sulfuritalea sp.]|nr:hypothetical protein [Sulfuritalea sp.]